MPNCPLVGPVRFVAYLCAMVESDVNSLNSLNSPTTGLLLVHLFKRPQAHAQYL